MTRFTKLLNGLFIAAIISLVALPSATATTITNGYTFQSLNPAPTGTGFGTYNVILFENSSGGSGNDGGGVNVDNSNRLLPTGVVDASGSLFWMTSIGDLRGYYDLSFGANKVTNIVLFLDINEQTSGSNPISVGTLNIWKNATTSPTGLNPSGANDLTSVQQESITGQSGGTLLKQLATSPQSLDQICTGAGCDDWAIFTGINPYDASFNPNDTLLFNFQISALDNGPEALTIRGDVSNCDFPGQSCAGGTDSGQIPEPSTLFLLASGMFLLRMFGRRKSD